MLHSVWEKIIWPKAQKSWCGSCNPMGIAATITISPFCYKNEKEWPKKVINAGMGVKNNDIHK